MKKVLAIVLSGVAILALASLAYYYYFLPADTKVDAIRNALEGKGAVTCNFSYVDSPDEGVLYARDGKIRVDSVYIDDTGDEITEERVYTLVKDRNYSYTWSDSEEHGLILDISDQEEEDIINPFFDEYSDDEAFKEELDETQFSCRRGATASLFELPSDREFIDYEKFLQQESIDELQELRSLSEESPNFDEEIWEEMMDSFGADSQ